MQIQENISLKAYNTFGIDVSTRYFTEFHRDDDIEEFFSQPGEEQFPLLFLGGGSNVLFSKDFPGTVICVRTRGIFKLMEDKDHVYIRIAAGEVWDDVVKYAVNHNLGGIENLSLIPGLAGAGPIQNIGAYGVELRDVIYSIEVADIRARHFRAFRPQDCEFGYRTSLFKKKGKDRFLVTGLCLRLDKHPVLKLDYGDIRKELEAEGVGEPGISDVRKVIIAIRRRKLPDPAIIGNAGSFFMNPVISPGDYSDLLRENPGIPSYRNGDEIKVPGAWLIEKCGWKGKRIGNAGVHMNQPLVLVNYGSASGREILHLAEAIIASIKDRFGITLETEVNII